MQIALHVALTPSCAVVLVCRMLLSARASRIFAQSICQRNGLIAKNCIILHKVCKPVGVRLCIWTVWVSEWHRVSLARIGHWTLVAAPSLHSRKWCLWFFAHSIAVVTVAEEAKKRYPRPAIATEPMASKPCSRLRQISSNNVCCTSHSLIQSMSRLSVHNKFLRLPLLARGRSVVSRYGSSSIHFSLLSATIAACSWTAFVARILAAPLPFAIV